MTTLYILEDEEFTAAGAQAYIHRTFNTVRVAGKGRWISQAIDFIREKPVDMILMDLFLQGKDPVENYRTLQKALPSIPVIILASEDDLLWQWRMMLEGAHGYIIKTDEDPELGKVIEEVSKGKQRIPGGLASFLDIHAGRPGIDLLKPVDLDIIRFRALRYPYKDISARTGKSLKAIEKRFSVLCNAFNVISIDELLSIFKN